MCPSNLPIQAEKDRREKERIEKEKKEAELKAQVLSACALFLTCGVINTSLRLYFRQLSPKRRKTLSRKQ